MKLISIPWLFFLLLIPMIHAAQPVNDNCSDATALIQTANCAPIPGTTVNASQSIPAIICQGLEGYADDDVWFAFTSTTHSPFITVVPSPGFDAVVDLRSSPCDGTTIDCSDSKGPGGTENIYTYGLLIGETYYIRIYSYGHGTTTQGDFTVCVYGSPQPPPVNDDCTGTVWLMELPFCSPYPGTTISASQSLEPILCNGATGFADDDVWYIFQPTTSNPTITVETTPLFDPVVDLREGPCNGTTIFCADAGGVGMTEKLYAAGLTIGQNYLIRVYSFGSDPNSPEDFYICVHETVCHTCSEYDFEISPGPEWQIHQSTTGSLGCSMYQFNASEGTEYTFKTGCGDGAAADFDTFLEIYNMDCDSLSSDDNSCENNLSRITWTSTYDGPAYLKIQGVNTDDFGSYSLAYKLTGLVQVPGPFGNKAPAEHIMVYPNPATRLFRINTEKSLITDVEIFNSEGLCIKHIHSGSPAHSIIIDDPELKDGFFFLSVITDHGRFFKKLEILDKK